LTTLNEDEVIASAGDQAARLAAACNIQPSTFNIQQ
jgi:hypothetical protein